jgi:hypothetical protein
VAPAQVDLPRVPGCRRHVADRDPRRGGVTLDSFCAGPGPSNGVGARTCKRTVRRFMTETWS